MSETPRLSSSLVTADVIRHPFWSMRAEEVQDVLQTYAQGLNDEEVVRRQSIFGANIVQEFRSRTKARIMAGQFVNPLIIILMIAGIMTVAIGHIADTIVIFAAVAANTFLGFYQENKAETVLHLLKTFIRTRARARRGGGEREIDARDLVPGDVVRIRQGDRIPADARLVFVNNFETDESVLTGESLPVAKDTREQPASVQLAERTSMAYGGTLAVQGFADAVVTATGPASEFGKIVSLVGNQPAEVTPLQRSLSRFAAFVGAGLVVLTAILFVVGLSAGYRPLDMFLISVAVAVSAVPEGLPVALTVILAVGVERIARRKGIVRKLLAAETLGSTTLILTDKTGTLTQAIMELTDIVLVAGASGEARAKLWEAALSNSDVVIENPDDPPDAWRIFGRPIEIALAKGAAREGFFPHALFRKAIIQDRLPFSSEYKYSAVLYRFDARLAHAAVLGAPEVIMQYTDLSEEKTAEMLADVDARASGGARVLGVAVREFPGGERLKIDGDLLSDFKFLGLIVFRDPIRPGVRDAVARIRRAGVRTIIVTGDHRGTAEAVARELGLMEGAGATLTGADLKLLTPEELRTRAPEVRVYARVTPDQKLMLSKLYQSLGEVVAVTGDGVNDAPALQGADIGVAVGSGTDVAKGAADLVILDNNFATIVAAIEEGRRILYNIRKAVVYLLSDAMDELFLIGGALVMGLALPLNALQILFVNFFSDSFPAIALAFEDGIDSVNDRPLPRAKGVFDSEVRFLILVIGVTTSFLLLILYVALLRWGFAGELVRTFIFASFASYTLFLSFSIRSLEKSILSYNPFSNKYLVAGVGIGVALTLTAVYAPFLQRVFHTVSLPAAWLAGVLGVGIFNIVMIEFGKWFLRLLHIRGKTGVRMPSSL